MMFSLSEKRFPFVGLLLGAMLGIIFEEYFLLSTFWLLPFAIVLGFIILTPFLKQWSQKLLFIFVAACFALFHAWQWQESPSAQLASFLKKSDESVLVEGMVASEPKISKGGSSTFFLNVYKLTLNEVSLALPLKMRVRWEGPAVAYGDEVRLRALAQAPVPPRNPGEFNVPAWLAREEIYTELCVDPGDPGEMLSSGHGLCFIRWAFEVRHWAERTLALGIADAIEVVSLIQGMVLGRSDHDLESVVGDFKLTGTMHLFAISGLHVGMVAVLLWFFFKLLRVPRRMAIFISIPALFFYVMMTGFHTGSWRAAIMASLVMSGFLFYRRPQILNSLAAAAFFLLAAETNLLFSAGWQFSFGVVTAIVLLTHPLQKLLRPCYEGDPFIPKKMISPWRLRYYEMMRHLSELVSVSLAAWIGALIPSIIYFHRISFSALGANVLAVPLAFVIFTTALVALICGFFSPWVAAVFNNANWAFSKMLLLLVHAWTLLPCGSVAVGAISPRYPVLTLFDVPGTQIVFLEEGGARWLINTGRTAVTQKTLLPFFETKGITQLEGLLLTEQDAAHLGGVALLVKSFPITSIMMGNDESRSLAWQQLMHTLQGSARSFKILHAGDQISFSKGCSAEILYPPAALQAEGNDALVLKIHLGPESLLLMPSASHELEEWLLNNIPSPQLHASVLVLPWSPMSLAPEDPFLKAVAPHDVVIGRDLRHQVAPNAAWKELFQAQGMTLFYQQESGALIFEALPNGMVVTVFKRN